VVGRHEWTGALRAGVPAIARGTAGGRPISPRRAREAQRRLLAANVTATRQASRRCDHGPVVSVPEVLPVSEASSTVQTCDGLSWHSA
jgi:hypothetical protein